MSADLHLHSCYSDGTYTPEELAATARRHGLQTIALTDHDTVEGCLPTAQACQAAGIEFIPGTELTSTWQEQEVHLLGYWLDVTHPGLLRALAEYQVTRQNRIREMVDRLNQLNIPLRTDSVFALANCRSPGRPHVARAMVQARYCRTIDQAFELYLKKHRPAWVPKHKVSTLEAIQLLHSAGGLAVLAHPGIHELDELIPSLAEMGLDGIECFHTKHTPAQGQRYEQMAQRLGLAATGGSDCHGLSKGKPLLGTVKLPRDYVVRLKERWKERFPPADPAPPAN